MVGRKEEIGILEAALNDDKSHFIAIYGRRRIGKTYLVRETFGNRFAFQHAGVADGTLSEQLFAFDSSCKDAGLAIKRKSKNWMEAFEYLKDIIRQSTEKKKIIFIDELSWMDTPRCDLMKALENFWNGWASARKDCILIVCASATSWMLSKVIHNKGGLYNRLTEQIHLTQFCLAECEELVKEKGIAFNRNQILQYYMIFGGVPFYWDFIKKGMSLPQIVDYVLFSKEAPLKDEFKYLFSSIFKNEKDYLEIVKALSNKKSGLTREQLITETGQNNSGDLTKKLDELESCGFVRKYYSYGKKTKNATFQLIDNFTLFYYDFINMVSMDEHFFTNQLNTPRVNTWYGLAFERVCLEHIDQIKNKLGIRGVLSSLNSWQCKADAEKGLLGSQIDLLIVRKDQVINLCEMKYSTTEYTITEDVYKGIQNKIHDLMIGTKTKYSIHPTLITTHGLVENAYANEIQAVVTMDDLFVY